MRGEWREKPGVVESDRKEKADLEKGRLILLQK